MARSSRRKSLKLSSLNPPSSARPSSSRPSSPGSSSSPRSPVAGVPSDLIHSNNARLLNSATLLPPPVLPLDFPPPPIPRSGLQDVFQSAPSDSGAKAASDSGMDFVQIELSGGHSVIVGEGFEAEGKKKEKSSVCGQENDCVDGSVLDRINSVTLSDGKLNSCLEKNDTPKESELPRGANVSTCNDTTKVITQKPSFKEALAGNRSNSMGKKLNFVEGYDSGIIKFTKKEVEKTTAKWKMTLLGMVIGANISFHVMSNFVAARWNGITAPKIILTDGGVFVFKFESSEDLDWVLNNGPWMIGGVKPLVLKRWSEGVKLDKSCFETAHVWVSLPNLDVRFWDEEFYARIGNALGKPVIVDKITKNEERLSFARLLVEISAKVPLKKEVVFLGEDGERIEQNVCYEWILDMCDKCQVFGHVQGQCFGLKGQTLQQRSLPFHRRVWVRRQQPGLSSQQDARGRDNTKGPALLASSSIPEQVRSTSVQGNVQEGTLNAVPSCSSQPSQESSKVEKSKGARVANRIDPLLKGKELLIEGSKFSPLSKILDDGDDCGVRIDHASILPNE